MPAVRLGLLGCGTVGGGVVRLLAAHREAFARRVGGEISLVAALVRDRDKERVPELERALVTTDPERLLAADLDVVVEVMGGIEPAFELVSRAIAAGRSVVTANKMLLATRGAGLISDAKARGVDLAFEAAVAGGIPVIRVLRDAFASDEVTELSGIVNGTSNHVLTEMRTRGVSFDEAVRDAQARGYAEADPSTDVDGHDAAHKLAVLAMVAFGAHVDEARIPRSGLRGLEAKDHALAARFGYVIKPLAIARGAAAAAGATGPLHLAVHPALVHKEAVLANVNGVLNAVLVRGRALGPSLLTGRGAGDMPTAVSVVADILDVARARLSGVTGLATRSISLSPREVADERDGTCRHYLRFAVLDRPGVIGRIATALGARGVSIEQMVQDGGGDGSGAGVDVVILTHAARHGDVRDTLAALETEGFSAAPPRVLRVYE